VSSTPHVLDLGHGVELRTTFPALDGSVGVALLHREHVLFSKTFTRDEPRGDFSFHTALARGDGAIEVDLFAGELAWEGHLALRLPGGWRRILHVDRDVLLAFAPAVGRVGPEPDVDEPVVDDPRYGRSQLCTPAVLRIPVDVADRKVADVGEIVKARMFPDHPPFTFNTVACVGGVEDGAPGLYTDPDSIWFNIFFGYYQLDAPKRDWQRPFGYRSADGIRSEIEPEDVVRLGKSDWNWFSNWMYGVPMEAVLPYSSPDMGSVRVELSPPERVGQTMWHALTLHGVEVASAYESGAPGAAKLVRNSIVDDVWRHAFGLPAPRESHPDSFIPTTIDARILMAYWEDDDAYHTIIFGGTVPSAGGDPRFLEAQMAAVRAVIERSYATLGFDEA
jgi:hypothetical protein